MRIFVTPHAAEQYTSRFQQGIPLHDACRKVHALARSARRTGQPAASGGEIWLAEDDGNGLIELVVKPNWATREWVIVTVLPARPGVVYAGEVRVDPDLELRREAEEERAAHAARMKTILEEEERARASAIRATEIARIGPLHVNATQAERTIKLDAFPCSRAANAYRIILAYHRGTLPLHRPETIGRAKALLVSLGVVFLDAP